MTTKKQFFDLLKKTAKPVEKPKKKVTPKKAVKKSGDYTSKKTR